MADGLSQNGEETDLSAVPDTGLGRLLRQAAAAVGADERHVRLLATSLAREGIDGPEDLGALAPEGRAVCFCTR